MPGCLRPTEIQVYEADTYPSDLIWEKWNGKYGFIRISVNNETKSSRKEIGAVRTHGRPGTNESARKHAIAQEYTFYGVIRSHTAVPSKKCTAVEL